MAKVLIAYFSHAGQNYTHGGIGYLEVGNTEVVAKKLHKLVDSNLFYIDTVKKYPDDHMKKIDIAKKEFEENVRPALTAKVENMEEYGTIILAFPNWWTTMPMALFTFLESYDFSGKTICPLITHGGSGFSDSLKDIARLCPGAVIKEGLAIHGDDAGKSAKALEKWVKKLGILL